jgi:hypothetical protein
MDTLLQRDDEVVAAHNALTPGASFSDDQVIGCDRQFLDALDAMRDSNAGLHYRPMYWCKRGFPATGPRWKNDGEFIFVIYSMVKK